MIHLKIRQEDQQVLQQGRYSELHPRVMQKYNVLWMKSNGVSNGQICEIEGICNNTLLSYIKQYNEGGLERLQEINFYRPQSTLKEFSGKIEKYFEENPPASISEAAAIIEQLTGVKRGETQVRKFMKDNDFSFRRVGTVPAKALTEGGGKNKENFWSKSQRHV